MTSFSMLLLVTSVFLDYETKIEIKNGACSSFISYLILDLFKIV